MPWVSRITASRVTAVTVGSLLFSLLTATSCFACGLKSVLVRGRLENAPSSASVVVELVYQKNLVGESDRLILDGGAFKTRITFSTQGKSLDVVGVNVGKCGRQPSRVAVLLMDGDEEIERVSLNFPRDFQQNDASEFVVRQDVVLNGR